MAVLRRKDGEAVGRGRRKEKRRNGGSTKLRVVKERDIFTRIRIKVKSGKMNIDEEGRK